MSDREKTVRWTDPTEAAALAPKFDGIDFLRKMAAGEIAGAPLASLINMEVIEVGQGEVTLHCRPDESHYNLIGSVHGGLVCTLLDSALGCAAYSTVPAGFGFTSVEIKTNYLRPVTVDSGPLICTGTVVKSGNRVVFAEGSVVDSTGKTVATASGSLLVFELGR